MNRLYNSRGNHIANEVNGELHEPAGKNIGHFLTREGIFIDMRGCYLGEIVLNDRLMRNRNSRHNSVNFGSRGYLRNGRELRHPRQPTKHASTKRIRRHLRSASGLKA